MKEYDFDFKDIVEHAKDVIVVTKADLINEPGPEIVYVNHAFTELTGYEPEEVIGKNPRLLQSEDTDADTKQTIRDGLEKQIPVRVTIKNYSKTGEAYWLDLSILPLKNSAGLVTHFVAIERDVSHQKRVEEQLEKLTRTDPLTGLMNRRALDDIANKELSRFKRTGEAYSVVILDIDNFKLINDKYGHAVGDLVIQKISLSCRSKLRMHDTVARIGGEEFVILLPSTNQKIAVVIAEKLRRTIAGTCVQINQLEISFTISLGVSEVNANDKLTSDVLQRADDSLYQAKKTGRNRVCFSDN